MCRERRHGLGGLAHGKDKSSDDEHARKTDEGESPRKERIQRGATGGLDEDIDAVIEPDIEAMGTPCLTRVPIDEPLKGPAALHVEMELVIGENRVVIAEEPFERSRNGAARA